MDEELLKKNLAILSQKLPSLANRLSVAPPSKWSLVQTGKKQEWNLRKEESGEASYIHSPLNIQVEARQSLGMHNLHGIDWIIIYGVGLGYYYKALQSWLQEKIEHRLIFIEDDIGIIQKLLETEIAGDLLSNPQVELHFLDLTDPQDPTLDSLAKKFMYQNTLFIPLVNYESNKAENAAKINYLINFKKSGFQLFVGEYLQKGEPFFKNFYHNLFQYPNSLEGNNLWKKFQGMPAIICGAGPSLQKNIDLLKTLKDKALIFAGGTAMNAVNAFGLTPHFGLGVDPFPAQFTRLIMNTGFETPFFYRNRMNYQAVEMIHGSKLYLTGASGYPIANWFDEKLHLNHPNLDEGCNVINMSLSIAEALGCNPIICVGLDLAYSLGQSYSPGIEMHAIHDIKENLITKTTEEELVLQNDIYGQPVYTLWKWIQESVWFSQFAYSHPDLIFLNATEGGIGFKGVPNITLQEAADKFLNTQYDFDATLHNEMLAIEMPEEVKKSQIKKFLHEFVESLTRCIEHLKEIYNSSPHAWEQKKPEMTPELLALEDNLKKETAYQVLLKVFDDNYKAYIQISTSEKSASSKILDHLSGRFAYLMEIAVDNLRIIDEVLQKQSKLISLEMKQGQLKQLPKADLLYLLEEHAFSIEDEELNIAISGPLKDSQDTQFANGASLKQYKNNGRLEGPSILRDKEGTLLSESYYFNGKKVGKARQFYPNGQLSNLQRFKEGLPDGKQEYYYENGSIKSLIHYKNGVLDGDVILYYSHGQLKRKLFFKEGKREGFDHIYNELGTLTIEAEYREGKPFGLAKMWYENGALSKEVEFNDLGFAQKTQFWSKDGQFVPNTPRPLDYFDQVTKQTEQLTLAIDQIVQNLSSVLQTLSSEDKEKYLWMQDELKGLKEQMANLQSISDLLKTESGISDGAQEPIWKTPSAKKLMQQYLEIMTGTMHETMRKMASEINFLQKNIKEKSDKK